MYVRACVYVGAGLQSDQLMHSLAHITIRAIYLRRSLPARFVFQIILLIGWHVGIFFMLPSDPLTGRFVCVVVSMYILVVIYSIPVSQTVAQ